MATATFWDNVLAFCQETTAAVGKQLLDDFGQAQADEKADGSLVTASDRWADQALRERILQRFPDHGVLSEEVEHSFPGTEWCWIIDPIDGTTNFTRGIPLWGISLGLLYQGTPIFGYVAIPPARQDFYGFWPGSAGIDCPQGAFRNGQPVHTSQAAPGKNQLFSLCARSTAVLSDPFPCKIRMLGVATYNLLTVASGLSLGAVEATPKIWDIAAVWAIAQAAGASWVALDDQPPFPLTAGQDYSRRSFPTLVAAQSDWLDTFRPLVQKVVQSGAS